MAVAAPAAAPIMGAIGKGLLAAAPSILGGLFGSNSAKSASRRAAEEAEKNRDWQQMMSSTAETRRVMDLKNAGLNPYLAYTGGAQVGSGATGQVFSPHETVSSAAKASGEAILQRTALTSQIALNEASAAKMKSEADVNYASIPRIQQDTNTGKSAEELNYGQLAKVRAEIPQIAATIDEINSRINNINQDTSLSQAKEILVKLEHTYQSLSNEEKKKLLEILPQELRAKNWQANVQFERAMKDLHYEESPFSEFPRWLRNLLGVGK